MDIVFKRFDENTAIEEMADNDIFPVERMSTQEDSKITFADVNKQILHNAEVSCSVNEENAQLTVALKDNDGETISTKTVDLPNTGTIDCEVDEDTAELTVQLKNTKGEVVTSDTVTLPNTSDVECELSATNELTVSLKDKSGEVVTSDSVQLESGKVDSLTQAEYDALSEAEKTNGQIREITDAEGEPVPFAVMNDEITTTSNVLSAQETENRIYAKITERPYIIRTVEYQDKWYRLFSDGWCEQGGFGTVAPTSTPAQVNFLIPYKTTNYSLTIGLNYNASATTFWNDFGYDRTVDGFKLRTSNKTSWISAGFVDLDNIPEIN